MNAPALAPLMTFQVRMSAPVSIDATPGRGRRLIPIIGGTVEGRYTGVVLPGGGDWQTVWDDGRMEIDARYAISIGGATVEIVSQGVRQGPPEVLERLARGEAVDPTEYYFRTSIRFRTAAPELAHLNSRLGIAVGARMADHVRIEIFEVM